MRRLERNTNIAMAVIPLLGLIASGVLLWNNLLGPRDLAIFLFFHTICGLGISTGYHRLFTHRAFETTRGVRIAMAIAGSLALQGPIITWVADHRKHHTFTDEEGDPHSPHVGHGSGFSGMLRGLWHSHVGWLFSMHGQASAFRYARDLVDDRDIRRIHKAFPQIALASIFLPGVVGFALSGGKPMAALTAFLWAGLARIWLGHHISWSINSICHFFGRRRFDTEDHSTNVAWLALASMGEAWHHNHHAFPRSAYHGLRRWEIDFAGMLVSLLERLGLAWDVVRISPEQQRAKLVGAESVAAEAAGV